MAGKDLAGLDEGTVKKTNVMTPLVLLKSTINMPD